MRVHSGTLLIAAIVMVVVLPLSSWAREADPQQNSQSGVEPTDLGPAFTSRDGSVNPPLRRMSVVNDTTVLGSWTFDGENGCDPQGWTSHDRTAQLDEYFHVDDFAGLGGGDFGRLVPLEGNQSLWCGVRPDPTDPELCGYYSVLPGYGNSWEQGFTTTACLNTLGDVTVDYLISWDSEPGFDYTTLRYDHCDDNWIDVEGGLNVWDGIGSGFYSTVIPDSLVGDSLRVQFWFVSDGAWSDEDGLHDSDGAVIIDSLTVSDAGGVVLPTERFESESPGDKVTASGNWSASIPPSYGDFAALFQGVGVVQEDRCVSNLTCLWGFFNGSTYDYACGGFPEQAAVPYENERGQYLVNEIWSPWIPLTGSGTGMELYFDIYRDLPLIPLVFYKWLVRSVGPDGCPDGWASRTCCYFGDDKRWVRPTAWFSDFVDETTTAVQVALAVFDRCQFWCGVYGTGECHTHAPLFDNVEVIRIQYNGPVWSVRDIDLFQDNFATDGTTTGTVRIDAAIDILPSNNPNIRPADSSTVRVSNPDVGLADDPYTGFGAAVYAYVGVWPQNQPGKTGDALTQSTFHWPVVDSLTHGGDTWYVVRMDTSFTNGTTRQGASPDAFCIDLNDNLLTPGDQLRFVFAATSAPPQSITTYYSALTGATDDMAYALDNAMEMTCLPTGGRNILYVDDFNGRGAQPFFDTAFDMLGLSDRVDRYDVRGSSSTVGNGPGARVTDVSQQLLSSYSAIIWNTGNLREGLIGDGTTFIEKSDDAGMLLAFLNGLTGAGGLYLSGDNLAEEWPLYSGAAIPLRDTYIQHTLTSDDHQDHGLAVSPHVVGVPGGCFDGDEFVAYGGCTSTDPVGLNQSYSSPSMPDFDVLMATGASNIEASYGGPGPGGGAVLTQQTVNPQAATVGVVLSGFSYHMIRDVEENAIPARVDHLGDILTWLGTSVPLATAAGPVAARYSLAQNVPNPFNPTTSIEFSVRERAPVTLRVYNVRGQLVKTLIDDTRAPGIVHRIEWDGRNAAGQSVASGVYFYRLVAPDYTMTRKMVLLK